MPKSKKNIHRLQGSIFEIEETYITHWVQLVGETVVRCDDAAKNTGWGEWIVCGPGHQSRTWTGNSVVAPGVDPENWLSDHHVETFVSEVDYS